jgi:ATP-dependent Zn protease
VTVIALSILVIAAVSIVAFARYRRHTKAVLRGPEGVVDQRAIDTWECRVAVHEAGHAAAAWCCTLVAAVNVATIENEGGGVVKYSFLNIPSPDAAWCRAVISLAGVAAEAHVYARWKTRGAEGDISNALELAHAARGHAPPWERLGGRSLDFQKMFAQKIAREDLIFLEESFHMARRILRAHGGDFFRLVSALLAMRTARELHLEPVLGRRRVARLALFGADVERVVSGESKLFKARFILPLKRHLRRAA